MRLIILLIKSKEILSLKIIYLRSLINDPYTTNITIRLGLPETYY
jgi:hypothetical protein